MKVAILGAGGQLGQALCRTVPGEVFALARSSIDITHSPVLRRTLKEICPDVVINCAAYTRVDEAESVPQAAFAVNTLAVRELALICRDLDCILMHFSTDHVFGLEEPRRLPYEEQETPGPINIYGVSKLAGEFLVRSLCARHFIIRTCGLYGPRGTSKHSRNFVTTMLQMAAQGAPIRVVDDQICTPTFHLDLAQAVPMLLTSKAYGVYHVTNAGACSWYEFAQRIFVLAKVSLPITPITSAAFAAPAQRPRYSVLCNRRWLDQGFGALRPWQEALASYLSENP